MSSRSRTTFNMENKINILDIIKQENYLQTFINNLESILRDYNLKEFKETMRLGDAERIEKIRESLARMTCEECDIDMNDVFLKPRRGNNKKDNCIADIYTLSHFFLDKQFSDQINDIFCLKTKPFDYINEKNKTKFLIEKVYSIIPISKSTNRSDTEIMADDEKLQKILTGLESMNNSIQMILNTQNSMQIQINKNSEDLERVKNDVNNITMNGVDLSMRDTNRGYKRRHEEVDKSVNKVNTYSTNIDIGITNQKENRNKLNYAEIASSLKNDGKPFVRKKTKVVGNGKTQDVKSAEKTFEVFVNNVHINDKRENVVQMFSNNGIQVLECCEYTKRRKDSKAFQVKIKAGDKYKIYKPELWADGVILSKFTCYNENKTNNNPIKKDYINLNSTKLIEDDA